MHVCRPEDGMAWHGPAAANAYQPCDLTVDDDTANATPPADLASMWTPAMQVNSDDKARQQRQQAEAESRSVHAEEAAAKNSQTTQLREEADPLQRRDKTKTGIKKIDGRCLRLR